MKFGRRLPNSREPANGQFTGLLERPNGPEKRTCQNGVTDKLLPNFWKLFRSAWWSLRRMRSRYAMSENTAGDVVRRHRGGDGKEKCPANVRAMRLESWPGGGNRQQSRGVPWWHASTGMATGTRSSVGGRVAGGGPRERGTIKGRRRGRERFRATRGQAWSGRVG